MNKIIILVLAIVLLVESGAAGEPREGLRARLSVRRNKLKVVDALTVQGSCLVTFSEFVAAAQCKYNRANPTLAQYNALCAQATTAGRITTKDVMAMFLAQIAWESVAFQYQSEIACTPPNSCPGSYDRGGANNQQYYGRGYMQLSWSYNYKACSNALAGNNVLVDNPNLVATDENYSWGCAFWFWKTNVATYPGYGGGFGYTTKAINGALECGNGLYKQNGPLRYQLYQCVAGKLGLTPSIAAGC